MNRCLLELPTSLQRRKTMRASRTAEKVRIRGEEYEANMAGAEAHTHFATFTARLKPCPCYKSPRIEFFRSLFSH